ncbi:cytochrome c3 family protein, partial [bacterium]|nr:cytochrome c3 family protein [bacterium]
MTILFCWLIMIASLSALGMENYECLDCHGKQEIKAETKRGESLKLYLPEDMYSQSRHEAVQCDQCHQTADEGGYAVTPHRLNQAALPDCADCHGNYFAEINAGFSRDIHVKNSAVPFRCDSCHDGHQTGYLTDRVTEPSPADQISFSNRICLQCHNAEIKGASRKISSAADAHHSLENAEAHIKAARCVDCHTAPTDFTNHQGLAKGATVACVAC